MILLISPRKKGSKKERKGKHWKRIPSTKHIEFTILPFLMLAKSVRVHDLKAKFQCSPSNQSIKIIFKDRSVTHSGWVHSIRTSSTNTIEDSS